MAISTESEQDLAVAPLAGEELRRCSALREGRINRAGLLPRLLAKALGEVVLPTPDAIGVALRPGFVTEGGGLHTAYGTRRAGLRRRKTPARVSP
jgi:hypothetical protein